MPAAIEIIGGQVTAPGTTLTAVTPHSGNSLVVRNAAPDSEVRLLAMWSRNQAAGTLRLRSPLLHDNVQGIRHAVAINNPRNLLGAPGLQRLTPQDTLTLELSGSATAGDIEQAYLLIQYDDLPGVNGRFISPDELADRIVQLVTIENTISTGTAGGWSGEEALNAEYNLLRANTDYALLGYTVSINCAAVRYRSTDFGNLGLGGPGDATNPHITARWFTKLAELSGAPTIPVLNSANIASILIDAATDENGADPIVTTVLAQLAPG